MCQVVNRRHNTVNMSDPDIVYIGRGSIWGNPHKMKNELGRGYVCTLYRRTLWKKIKAGEITIEMLKSLDGKRLACYCAPKQCHGDIIKRAVQWAKEKQ